MSALDGAGVIDEEDYRPDSSGVTIEILSERRAVRDLTSIATVLALIAGFSSAGEPDADASRLDNFYVEGAVLGASSGTWGNGSLFGPLRDTDNGMIFMDVRGAGSGDVGVSTSYGIGFRHWFDDEWIFGSYLFYDHLFHDSGNTYQQISAGCELLSIDWDARFNLYIPREEFAQTGTEAHFEDDRIRIYGLTEVPLRGTDVEVGRLLKDWRQGDVELRGYLGAYWFDCEIANFDSVAGPSARVEVRLFDLPWLGNGSRLVAAGQLTWDSLRESQALASLTLRVPLRFRSSPPLGRFDRRKLNPIARRPGVFVQHVPTVEPAAFPDGRRINRVVVIDADTPSPSETIRELGPDSLAILDGSAGGIELDQTVQMHDGQTLIGGGVKMEVAGSVTGGRASFRTPGEVPYLRQRSLGPAAIVLPRRNGVVRNVRINSFGDAISGTNIVDATLSSVRANSQYVSGTGLRLQGNNMHLDIQDSDFNGAQNGMILEGKVSGHIWGNSMSRNSETGVLINGDLLAKFWSNSIENNGQGFVVNGRVAGDVSGNRFHSNRYDGVLIDGDLRGNFEANTSQRNGGSGFRITGAAPADITYNAALENGEYGFFFEESSSGAFHDNESRDNYRGDHF